MLLPRFATFAALAALLPASAMAAPVEYRALRPGLWEVQTSTEMLNMPVELPPVPYRTTLCLTQEQLNNQENLTAVSGAQGDCQILSSDVTEQRTNWTMLCKKNGMNFDAQGTITPISLETYTGNVRFTMSGARNMPPMNGITRVQGVWQGECKGNPAASAAGVTPTFKKGAN